MELLGGFRVIGDARVSVAAPTPRQQEIISYLILHAQGAAIPRQRVAGSLWPESTDQQALTNLRRELHHLREDWPGLSHLLDPRSRTLAWRGDADVTAFDQHIDHAGVGDRKSLEQAVRLYKGDLLPDCSAPWIAGERERLRQHAVSAWARLVELLEKEGAFVEAIARAEQLIRLDPLHEEAWCALMRCHARRGERAAALHVYQECTALLKRELGVQPSPATRITYREILSIDDQASAAPAAPRTAAYPLVGRDDQWRTLLRVWREADQGRARMVVLRGESGIGKTRLAEELIDWCRVKNLGAVTARCYAGEGRLAFAPIAAWLRSASLRSSLAALDPAVLSDVARLNPEVVAARPDVPAPDPHLEHWQRLRFFDGVAQAFRAATPLVMVVDDLQWADADTLEWLQYFLQSAPEARCLILGTVRAEEEQDNAPLGRLLRQLAQDGTLTAIPLGRLDRQATAHLAGAVAERDVDEDTLTRTFRDTEGHPLFIVERGRMEHGAGDAAASTALSRVQSVVAARLALLSPDARAVAEVAAAVGRDFTFDILAQASDLEEAALVRALDELWRRHIVRVQSEARWDFSHDRIREVAYSGLGPARAPLVHRCIARGMELLHADRLDEVSALIAVHLDRGGQPARAVPFLQRAAAVASQIFANEEAIRCLTYALSLLPHLPAGRDRDDLELAIRTSLSVALNSARGYADPDIEQNLDRVVQLFARDGESALPTRWLWVAGALRFVLGDLPATLKVNTQALARAEFDPTCRCEAHQALAGTLCCMGQLEASRQHFEAALRAYDTHPRRSPLGSDPGVFSHAWYSHTLWLLGEEPAALAHVDEAVALARRLDLVYSEALAVAYAAMLHQMRRDTARMLDCAQEAVRLCDRYRFGYYGDWARVLIGWAQGQEQPAVGIQAIESALARLDLLRAQARRPYFMSLLADTHRAAGRPERAAALLDDAIAMALARSDVWWLPSLYFQKSRLEPPGRREATRSRGLSLAQSQHSRSLQRRIAAEV